MHRHPAKAFLRWVLKMISDFQYLMEFWQVLGVFLFDLWAFIDTVFMSGLTGFSLVCYLSKAKRLSQIFG